MTIVLTIHSLVRWAITLVALALIVRLGVGLARKLPFDKLAAGLTSAFTGLMDTQLLLGLLFFLVSGFGGTGFPRYRWEHATVMTLAVIVAHLPRLWKQAEDQVRTRNTLLAVTGSLVLILIGILPIGGWARWWHVTGLF